MTTREKVLEIMKQEKMNTNDEILVLNCEIIYVTAQRQLLQEQLLKETK